MAIGIDEIDFDDEGIVVDNATPTYEPLEYDIHDDGSEPQVTTVDEGTTDSGNDDNQQTVEEEEDALTSYLKFKGIEDPSKIKFENENGETEEIDWNSLSREEQLNILKTSDEDPDTALDDAEIELINQMRTADLTPEEFIQMIKQQGAAEYAKTLEETPQYKIDDLTDDELFILDLQTRIEDITEEESLQALEKAKSDEALFTKQMAGIRNEYKRIEDEANERESAQQEQLKAEQYQQFEDSILNSIQRFNKVGGLDIEMDVDDMNDVANFILSADGAGVNYLAKALNNPDTLVKMAWFAIKGEQAFNDITEYFTNQIKEVSKTQYAKGLEDGKAGKSQTASRVVTRKPNTRETRTYTSIDDLD